MQDVLIKPNDDGLYDIQIDGADFASAEGFETAIPTSLFSDARASSIQVENAKDRRGWVGNVLFIDIDRELGGLLWTLDQVRITENILNFAKTFAQDSLQWMLDDNIAKNIFVSVEKVSDRSIKIFTNITTIDNQVQRYVTLWKKTDINRTI